MSHSLTFEFDVIGFGLPELASYAVSAAGDDPIGDEGRCACIDRSVGFVAVVPTMLAHTPLIPDRC